MSGKEEADKGVKNIGVPEKTHDAMVAYCLRRDKVKTKTVGRILQWFLLQPEPMKRVILGEVTEGMNADYADRLLMIAAELRGEDISGYAIVTEKDGANSGPSPEGGEMGPDAGREQSRGRGRPATGTRKA